MRASPSAAASPALDRRPPDRPGGAATKPAPIPAPIPATRPAPLPGITPDERRALVAWLATCLRAEAADPGALPGCPPPGATRLWAALPALAEAHGLGALLAGRLAPLAPGESARALGDLAERTLARGRRLADEVALIAAAFDAAGLRYAWLKGAHLAPLLYDPPAARPMADLDLWLHPGDASAAESLLMKLGYAPAGRSWKHRRYLRPDNRRVVDWRGEHPDNPRPVELHEALVESFRGIRLDLSAGGPPACANDHLPPALVMAHLAAHAGVDALQRRLRLVQLVDLRRLAARLDSGDWERIEALAGRPQAARFVWPGLFLAERWLGLAMPPARASRLAAEVSPALRDWLDRAEPDAISVPGAEGAPRAMLEIARIWPLDAAEHMAYWRFVLWPSRAQLADRYPALASSPAWPLAYLRHGGYNARRFLQRWRRRA